MKVKCAKQKEPTTSLAGAEDHPLAGRELYTVRYHCAVSNK